MLEGEDVQKVRSFLANQGWTDVVRPLLVKRGKEMIEMLMRPGAERPGRQKDINEDVLRGQYREIEWMITHWDNEVRVAEHNRSLTNGERER